MKWLDPIEELYDLYLEEEDSPRVVEVALEGLDLELDLEDCYNLPLWTID